jgi:hypothetical protein
MIRSTLFMKYPQPFPSIKKERISYRLVSQFGSNADNLGTSRLSIFLTKIFISLLVQDTKQQECFHWSVVESKIVFVFWRIVLESSSKWIFFAIIKTQTCRSLVVGLGCDEDMMF